MFSKRKSDNEVFTIRRIVSKFPSKRLILSPLDLKNSASDWSWLVFRYILIQSYSMTMPGFSTPKQRGWQINVWIVEMPRWTVTWRSFFGTTTTLRSRTISPAPSSNNKPVSPIVSPDTKIDCGVLTDTFAISGFPTCTTVISVSIWINSAESSVILRISSFANVVAEPRDKQSRNDPHNICVQSIGWLKLVIHWYENRMRIEVHQTLTTSIEALFYSGLLFSAMIAFLMQVWSVWL